MFGCVVAGRLVQTNMQQLDDTHAVFELPSPATINHICVFLLGTVPFPEGYGASVHLHWPGRGFQLLGMLSNDKPSALFRVRGTFAPAPAPALSLPGPAAFRATHDAHANADANTDAPALLGLSVEPLHAIHAAPTPGAHTDPQAHAGVLAQKIARHLFTYLSSFVGGGAAGAVPLPIVERWYENFMGKVRAGGVGFLERGE